MSTETSAVSKSAYLGGCDRPETIVTKSSPSDTHRLVSRGCYLVYGRCHPATAQVSGHRPYLYWHTPRSSCGRDANLDN